MMPAPTNPPPAWSPHLSDHTTHTSEHRSTVSEDGLALEKGFIVVGWCSWKAAGEALDTAIDQAYPPQ